MHCESLVVTADLVLEEAESEGFTEDDRRVGVAAPVNAGVDTVAERDVVGEFVQLSVDGEIGCVGARVWLSERPSGVGTCGLGMTKFPSKKNFRTVMQAPATTPWPVG